MKRIGLPFNKIAFGILWLLTLAASFVPAARAAAHKAEKPEGQRLIAEADAISRGFSPEERADLLLDILGTPAGSSPESGRRWSLELFSISKTQLRPGSYRAAVQKNALIDLAKVDPAEASKLFKTQDTPDMWNQQVLMEDYRAWVARALFPRLWAQSGMASIRRIKEFADWLGSTGEYPYVAMIGIVQSTSKIDGASAEELVSDGVGFYRTNPPFVNKHREFTAFIVGVADQVRPSLISKAIEAELDALDADKKDSDANKVKYVIQATNSQTSVQFSQQAEYIVYKLLPVINRLDQDWAKQVKDKYEVLKYLPQPPDAGSTRVTGVAIMPDTQASSADIAAAMDDHRLFQVSTLTDSDPKQAAEIAASIQDPGRRAVAQALLIPAYDKLDSQKAIDWREGATSALEHLPAGKIRLKLTAALANAALVEGKQELALELFGKAFDLGQMMFTQDLKENPGKMAYATEGEEDLATLVTDFTKASKVRSTVVEQTRGVRNDVLKAKLLVAAAKGVLAQESSKGGS